MEKFAFKEPKVLVKNSLDLNIDEIGLGFRFIHLDGSHLYNLRDSDLSLAMQIIHKESGVIAIDDFRAEHTPDVAAAIWKLVVSEKVKPIIITVTKMYCMLNSNWFDAATFRSY
jgi:hypothetical protein